MNNANTAQFVQLLKGGKEYEDWNSRDDIPAADGKLVQIEYSDADFWSKLTTIYSLDDLGPSDLVAAWTRIRESIDNSTISESIIGEIFRVAAHIKKVEDKTSRIIGSFAPPTARGVVTKTGLDTAPIVFGQSVTVGADITVQNTAPTVRTTDAGDAVVSAPYLCMALLRLMTKPVESFNRSLTTIRTSYGRFYGMQSAEVTNFSAPLNSLQQLSTGLDTYPTCNSTMAWMMGFAEGSILRNNKNHGFMRFLIFQHAEMRGMQIYKMILTALAGLPAITPAQFLRAIEIPDAVKAIKTVMKIATTLDKPGRQDPTYWWKYGKYIEPSYFVDLSVGRNTKFAYLMACILNEMSLINGPEYANPKNIKALESIKNNIELTNYYEGLSRNFSILYRSLETESGIGIGIAMQMGGAPAPKARAQKRANEEAPPAAQKRATPAAQQDQQAAGTSGTASATPVDAMNAALQSGVLDQLP
ncbi:nucleocapsid protein [Potato yellow dwarf virus]|uniref:Nucleoprotein n=2 Tax=Alphanucleorhabdovirus tuberosum TaxID=2749927 RepID=A8VSP2_9RHAB|nr:nucleocapsid protein [Potato yellow dwarf virus]ABW35154.1 nucleocapsid protein [Potato yellow dwarf virus]ADE45268.1 nucleocapsid protein [Potato yellow dwarf virus]QYA72292.1 nucleocapsid protein [Alphanucleorhabdovirus tuberosum]